MMNSFRRSISSRSSSSSRRESFSDSESATTSATHTEATSISQYSHLGSEGSKYTLGSAAADGWPPAYQKQKSKTPKLMSKLYSKMTGSSTHKPPQPSTTLSGSGGDIDDRDSSARCCSAESASQPGHEAPVDELTKALEASQLEYEYSQQQKQRADTEEAQLEKILEESQLEAMLRDVWRLQDQTVDIVTQLKERLDNLITVRSELHASASVQCSAPGKRDRQLRQMKEVEQGLVEGKEKVRLFENIIECLAQLEGRIMDAERPDEALQRQKSHVLDAIKGDLEGIGMAGILTLHNKEGISPAPAPSTKQNSIPSPTKPPPTWAPHDSTNPSPTDPLPASLPAPDAKPVSEATEPAGAFFSVPLAAASIPEAAAGSPSRGPAVIAAHEILFTDAPAPTAMETREEETTVGAVALEPMDVKGGVGVSITAPEPPVQQAMLTAVTMPTANGNTAATMAATATPDGEPAVTKGGAAAAAPSAAAPCLEALSGGGTITSSDAAVIGASAVSPLPAPASGIAAGSSPVKGQSAAGPAADELIHHTVVGTKAPVAVSGNPGRKDGTGVSAEVSGTAAGLQVMPQADGGDGSLDGVLEASQLEAMLQNLWRIQDQALDIVTQVKDTVDMLDDNVLYYRGSRQRPFRLSNCAYKGRVDALYAVRSELGSSVPSDADQRDAHMKTLKEVDQGILQGRKKIQLFAGIIGRLEQLENKIADDENTPFSTMHAEQTRIIAEIERVLEGAGMPGYSHTTQPEGNSHSTWRLGNVRSQLGTSISPEPPQ